MHEICPECVRLCHATILIWRSQLPSSEDDPRLSPVPKRMKLCFSKGHVRFCGACKDKLVRDIELQMDLKGLSK